MDGADFARAQMSKTPAAPPALSTVKYVRSSEVLTREEMDEIEMNGRITFGDANLTLIRVDRIENALNWAQKSATEKAAHRLTPYLKEYGLTLYIDLEN